MMAQTTRYSDLSTVSNQTYILPSSPMKRSRSMAAGFRPEVVKTIGTQLQCLVNASMTYYSAEHAIYAFGGFDQDTDEVYNHVLKLDLNTMAWSLVDNFGDIPGVRMGHTACLWNNQKIVIHGGENEHREHLSDVLIFDIPTATWTSPAVKGVVPRGRARHAAVIYDDRLFITGGLQGGAHESEPRVLDDIAWLDLKTFTWQGSFRLTPRRDHTAWVHGSKFYIFGGMNDRSEKVSELFSWHIKNNPILRLRSDPIENRLQRVSNNLSPISRSPMISQNGGVSRPHSLAGVYNANMSTVQSRIQTPPGRKVRQMVPGTTASLVFNESASMPSPKEGSHFIAPVGGCVVDFVTPMTSSRTFRGNIWSFDLDDTEWSSLLSASEIFDLNHRWHYCVSNTKGTKVWFLGSAMNEPTDLGAAELHLHDVLSLDLEQFGIIGNAVNPSVSSSNTSLDSFLSRQIGDDLLTVFDKPVNDGGSDFAVTAILNEDLEESFAEDQDEGSEGSQNHESRPILVHKLILQARWPYFRRVYAAQMQEFHTRKLHIREPYTVVRAFLRYLYTDSITSGADGEQSELANVAGMLVMANIYDMPELRLLCVNKLNREMEIEAAARIWERATVAGEDWLAKRAATYCFDNFGLCLRSEGFRKLSRAKIGELFEMIDAAGRVVHGEELDAANGMFLTKPSDGRNESPAATNPYTIDEEELEDDAMESDNMDLGI